MQITRLEAWPVPLALTEPYTIAYETVESAANVFVRLHTDGPHVGHGCAAPDPAVTGETPDDALAALRDVAGPAVVGLDPTRPAVLLRRLHEAVGRRPSVLAAVDMAAWDLLGRYAQLPLWKILGGDKECVRTSMTIGILPEGETVEQARRWVKEGFRFLKLKGGRDASDDVSRVRKVREAVGPDVGLAFDANQGYSTADALALLRGCAGVGLAFLEQPTPRRDFAALGEVQRQTATPVMADESVTTPPEALELAAGGSAKLFNVKLMKVGGIGAALAIDAVAEGAGVGVMVGCLDEAALGIAAGLHFALGRPNVVYADLDSHFTMAGDPSAGAVRFRDGFLYPNPGPGLGFTLD
jgi:L-alanine-DL-glutamate epimerase-like enolase superfamily enzyme